MKKLLALLLVLAMSASLIACGKTEAPEENEPIENVESQLEENEAVEEETQEEEETEKTEEKAPVESEKTETSKKPAKNETSKEEPAQKPAEKPAQSAPSTGSSTVVKPSQKPVETPAEKPVEKPAEKPAETPAEKPAESTGTTVGSKLAAEFNKKANSGSALSVAESIANGGSLPFMAGAMEVEPGLLAGFDNYEVSGFKSGAVFQPMIGSIAFIGYVFELEDGASASDFASNLKKNANLRWNICVEAEEMVTSTVGNKVFFVMCPKTFEE